MAELLTVVGGIASFAQILGIVFQATETVASFCSAIKDAPDELCRVREKLLSLRTSLESIQVQLDEIDDNDLLPPDMCYILHNAVRSIYEDVIVLNKRCIKSLDGESRAIGKRLKWAFVERHLMSGMLERLQSSESTMTCILQLLNFRLSLLIYASQKQVINGKKKIAFTEGVFDNGQSPLHLAAEIADNVAVLEYLCNQGFLDDLDRQEVWGWTPLHYGIMSAFLWKDPSIEKVRFLLSKGAKINIKGRRRENFGLLLERMPAGGFTPGQMCRALDLSLYEKFEREFKIVGASLEDESLE
ncbi:ankyrin [Penicillium malachiteum]|uniref:Ankyrin n=1 Tax=Penicillium malachiteum TaxID=1324776 RepID=A0AAD6HXD5_9EURO|nr:ankyrin [Penicillium malachiteum]